MFYKLKERESLLLKCFFVFILAILLFSLQFAHSSWAGSGSKTTPGKVTVKSLKTSGSNKVVIKWNKAKNVSSYRISYKTGDGGWVTVATVKGSKTSYTHKFSKNAPIVSGRKYTYKVEGYNKKSNKYGASKAKSISIPGAPGTVELLSATATANNKIVVKWKKAANVTNYKVYYKQAGAKKWKEIASVKGNKTSYTHKSSKKAPLKKGKTYFYTVKGYNSKTKKTGDYNKRGIDVVAKAGSSSTNLPLIGSNKPQPSTPSSPTQQPAKPTTPAPNPVAPTPVPSNPVVPTPTPQPSNPVTPSTPQPSVVKVNSMDLSSPTLSFTTKGQSSVLSVTVLPANATNKSVVWSSSNNDVATVDESGKVTAKANGNAVITAAAADGSGVKRFCSVTVEIENVEKITLKGKESDLIGPDYIEFPSMDFSKVTFEFSDGFTNNFDIGGFQSSEYAASAAIRALYKGSGTITAKYNGKVIKKYQITVTSDWQEWKEYSEWRKQVASQIIKPSMSNKEKADAVKDYIKSNFTYRSGYGDAVLIYMDKMCDCIGSSDIFGDFMKDLKIPVKYGSTTTGKSYDYIAYAITDGGHTFNYAYVNNSWVIYDAQPQP